MTRMHGTAIGQGLSVDVDDECMLMAEYAISNEGRGYFYNGYHYDRLADAVAYAKLMRSRPSTQNPRGSDTQRARPDAPSSVDQALMTSLTIRFEAGTYRFEGFCYDRLADAVNYARLFVRR